MDFIFNESIKVTFPRYKITQFCIEKYSIYTGIQ